jgi:hypothetical protein
MKLKTITITGADNSIGPWDLMRLSKDFPFVEWGILIINSSEKGFCRFPSYEWIREAARLGLNLSAHFCGELVENICNGDWSFAQLDTFRLSWFNRIQLNFHGRVHDFRYYAFLRGLKSREQQIIFQMDGVNTNLFHIVVQKGIDVVPLFDLSGGAGILPDIWPEAEGSYSGYAGGLSAANIDNELSKIARAAGGSEFWIDVETHVRSNNDKLFDLDKVRSFLEIASKRINL